LPSGFPAACHDSVLKERRPEQGQRMASSYNIGWVWVCFSFWFFEV
jgi:hypothetical protein